ncbi:hypothetical protein TanjilG_16078 [Lupinus angustifolius]|uniref:SKP1-like protein n=1 Tax=Lupinus angustifolius TaxID=3871 RepID=A0A4P1RHD8_LUPAN|nr:PREDICTED: SKP1-like protein 14 [Lupinus angustifolius]OIW10706.1 hypothetical protein TanjilG_16078 [Lupinus angustifolius]
MAAISKNTISLKTADGDIHEVSPMIAKQMQIVQSFIEEESFETSTVIPLPNVKSVELSKIIEYLNYHQLIEEDSTYSAPDDAKKRFNARFVKELSGCEMIQLILAANYLDVKDLLEFMCQAVANLIKNKSVEFVRKFFGVVNDFTPEEEEKIRKENQWAFENIDKD